MEASVLVLGARRAGKSALVTRAVGAPFTAEYRPTVGADMFQKLVAANGEKLTLNLWCCGGETRLRPLVQQLYEGARAALLVYSMGSAASFQELAYWYNEMRRAAPGAALVLVGTHSDAADRIRVTEDDGLKQARAWGVAHFAVSSATGRGVEELFAALARLLAPPAEENAAE